MDVILWGGDIMGFIKNLKNIFKGGPGDQPVNEVKAEDISQIPVKSVDTKKDPVVTEPQIMPEEIDGIPMAYHYKTVDVCIIDDKRPDFKRIKPNMPVTFVPEPTNPYDTGAVIVKTENMNIGYLYKGTLQRMTREFLKSGYPIRSYIQYVDGPHDAVSITMGFYKEKTGKIKHGYEKLIEIKAPYRTYKLTGNRNDDMQEALSNCSEGEEVECEFDDDKDRYIAVCGDDIGYFPKAAGKYLDDDRRLAFIKSIEEDDNDKYIVEVAVFYEN